MRSSTICNTRSGPNWRLLRTTAAVAGRPGCFVALQSPGNVALGVGQGGGQRLRIEDRLRGAVGADRIHRMRGVPQQGYAPEAPAIDRIAINHRVFEDALRSAEQCWKIDEAELPVSESRQEVFETALMRPTRSRWLR
jgi:hypothetical protein